MDKDLFDSFEDCRRYYISRFGTTHEHLKFLDLVGQFRGRLNQSHIGAMKDILEYLSDNSLYKHLAGNGDTSYTEAIET